MPSHTDLPLEPLDVLIMGAGVSGIGAAAYLRRDQPHKVIAILESREQMGGTGSVPLSGYSFGLGSVYLWF